MQGASSPTRNDGAVARKVDRCCSRSLVRLAAIPVYQRIAAEATQMRATGGTVKAIRLHFGVDHHTVEKAIRWFRQRST